MFGLKRCALSIYVKNFILLSCGTFLAQLIPIIFYPIISRLFAPENLGTLATLNAITAILSTIATGKYDVSILIARSREGAVNILVLVVGLSILLLLILLLFFYVFSDCLAKLLNVPCLISYFYVPFISAFTIIIYQVYNEWCVRNKYFKNLSFNKIINSSSISGIEMGVGMSNIGGGFGIVWGDLCGRLVSACCCIGCIMKKEHKLFYHVTFKRIFLYAKRYINCPKYFMPGQLLNTLGLGMPVFVIGAFFSQKEVGFFSMANMVVTIPASVISLAMRDVFRQRANNDYHESGSCRAIYIKTAKSLFFISLIGFFVFYLIAPKLFVFVLGKQWLEAGIYARILVPMVAISFVSQVMSAVFVIAEKMRSILYWQILYVVITIVSLFVGIWLNDIYVLLVVFVFGRVLVYFVSMILTYRFTINARENDLNKLMRR